MLARISSGAEGIAEYLETGRKKGREFDRDLIDERYVLSGDIDTLEAVIASIQTAQPGAARYLHITLGFSERFTSADVAGPGEVNLATITAATEAYRELLMTAYQREEYEWYAEAHIPKVSHDIHATTGEAMERLPHVHIVLPMRNLVDGKYLNPTGYGLLHIDYEQAIQETINARFRLRSPQDAARDSSANPDRAGTPSLARHTVLSRAMPTAAAEITSAQDLKEALRQQISNGAITSFEQLAKAAGAYGTVRIRHSKDGDYLNVKPAWGAKGINLKDFTPESFAAGEAVNHAREALAPKAPSFDALLSEWIERVALEARFLSSANRKRYQALDSEGKRAWLAERAAFARALVRRELGESPEAPIQFKEVPHDRPREEAERQHLVAVAALQSDPAEDRRQRPPETVASVRHLSELDLAQHAGETSVLLQPHASDDLAPEGRADPAVRRQGNGGGGVAAGDARQLNGRRSKRDVAGGMAASISDNSPSPEQLKTDTSPSLVLEAAAARFGIDRARYDITSGRDGAPRIRHADRHYNLGDFFTKHLDVPWSEARRILEQCYFDTLADSLPPPDKSLWQSFANWRTNRYDHAAREKLLTREVLSRDILDARTKFKSIKVSAHRMPAARRQALLAKARAEQLMAIEEAKARAQQRRVDSLTPSRNAMYRTFLMELANRGQLNALAELRRLAKPEPEKAQTITGRASRTALPLPRYRVDHLGKVTYFASDQAVVTDSLRGVSVVAPGETSYALALKVAVARYGTHLTFNGDATFMRGMFAAARASGLELTIRDAARPSAPALHLDRGGHRR